MRKLAQLAMLLTYIQKVPSSNLNQDTDHLDIICNFPVTQSKFQDTTLKYSQPLFATQSLLYSI
jgi:hypothetical protein